MQQMITLTIEIEREDDHYVATCRELDVSNFGASIEEAAERLENAVLLYLNVLEEDGERERIFRERGIEVEQRLASNYRVDVHPGVYTTVRHVSLPA